MKIEALLPYLLLVIVLCILTIFKMNSDIVEIKAHLREMRAQSIKQSLASGKILDHQSRSRTTQNGAQDHLLKSQDTHNSVREDQVHQLHPAETVTQHGTNMPETPLQRKRVKWRGKGRQLNATKFNSTRKIRTVLREGNSTNFNSTRAFWRLNVSNINNTDIRNHVANPWPTAFYIGMPKAGSTSLFRLLMQHPHLCPPHLPGRPQFVHKEPSFFYLEQEYSKGREQYREYFRDSPKCTKLAFDGQKGIFFDGSTRYLQNNTVPRILFEYTPSELRSKLRFVVILREPVERDRSWRGQVYRNRRVNLTDEVYLSDLKQRLRLLPEGELVQDLWYGYYDELLQPWWDLFRKDQFLVLSYETMKANETDTLRRVLSFVGLDAAPIAHALELPHVNVDPKARSKAHLGDVDPALCLQLRALYQPHVDRLYRMLSGPGASPWQPPFPPFPDPCRQRPASAVGTAAAGGLAPPPEGNASLALRGPREHAQDASQGAKAGAAGPQGTAGGAGRASAKKLRAALLNHMQQGLDPAPRQRHGWARKPAPA